MPEEVLFSTETTEDRETIAASLRSVADKLDAGEDVTLSAAGDSITLAVPARATFEVKAERETGSGPDELSIEFEIEWDDVDDAGTDPSLSVE
ncbi:amphi-Trp domain-containing protein [Halorubrum sp. DTA98]|uniref:amphi-Trp domain-containing protein n=1 Tax=Halorubrum sp. DTA98 TaxID=3402163 RepID=UPI003AADF2F0